MITRALSSVLCTHQHLHSDAECSLLRGESPSRFMASHANPPVPSRPSRASSGAHPWLGCRVGWSGPLRWVFVRVTADGSTVNTATYRDSMRRGRTLQTRTRREACDRSEMRRDGGDKLPLPPPKPPKSFLQTPFNPKP